MINQALLSDTLAKQMASEIIYSRLTRAVEVHLVDEITKGMSKELLDVSLAYIAELKRNLFFDKLFKSLVGYEKRFKIMLRGIWEEERKIIIANLKKMKKMWLKKDAIDQILYPKSQFEKKLSAQTAEIILVILADKGAEAMGEIGLAGVSFDVQNPEVQKWLKSYTPKFSTKLEKVSIAKLRAELIEGMNAGEGIAELTERVNGTYAHWNKVRSESIAQNQAIRASNRANLEAYKQSGVVKKKVWIANPGACHWCAPLDGKIVELEKPFMPSGNIGDEYTVKVNGKDQTIPLDYETIETPPLHTRCRCSISAWIEE